MNPLRASALGSCVFSFALVFFLFALPASAQPAPSNHIRFTDVTEKSHIRFTHFKGNKGISINLEEFGPGVCVADFDGDGWQDIYFVNGRDRYDRGEDRGWWDRASDAVASWFGDEDAERRRHMDQQREHRGRGVTHSGLQKDDHERRHAG